MLFSNLMPLGVIAVSCEGWGRTLGRLVNGAPDVGDSLTSLSPVLSRGPVVVPSAGASCMRERALSLSPLGTGISPEH